MSERAKAVLAEIQAMTPSNQLRLAADLIDEVRTIPDPEKQKSTIRIAYKILEATSSEIGMLLHRLDDGTLEIQSAKAAKTSPGAPVSQIPPPTLVPRADD